MAPGSEQNRIRTRTLALLAGLALAALFAWPLTGCDRTPRLVPASADSVADVPDDPYEVMMKNAVRQWEGGDYDAAADVTARLLRVDLRGRESGTWARRATSLLDSMNVGAEIASAECAIVVNLFARANPTGASWPYVFWCSADTVRQQPVQGKGLRLLKFAARDVNGEPDARGLAVLFGQGDRGGVKPTLMVYGAEGNGWTLTQTLGPDSLGGTGEGEFDRVDGAIELHTTTYETARGFLECSSCPHVFTEQRFRWEGQRFAKVEERQRLTPYATFVRLIQALRASDYVSAMALVTDRIVVETAVYFGWGRGNLTWRVAPGTEEMEREMVFFHGQGDAYRVWFERRGEAWAVASIDTTRRTLDVID